MNSVFCITWLLWAACATAVYVGWPMNEQLPNVARVNESYSFTLADSTYKSSAGGSITYAAQNLPSWLSFDAGARTFTGTPSTKDMGTFQISLSGTDSADTSEYNASYSMLVSDSAGLALSSNDVIFTEIAQYGRTNGVDGLVVTQGESFSLQFSKSAFKSNSGDSRPIIAYYGRSGDRTSLPNWINFDSDSLTFSGQVPYVTSDIAPSIEYTFAFIASDYTGYTGAEGTFKLVVGAHQLSTSLNESIKINGTYGSAFQYTVPVLTDVFLDNEPISKANISSVVPANLPSYVSFDASSFALSGTFPNASSFQNFTVVVSDVYGDSVSLPYSFDSMDSVFTVESLPDINATRGEYFSYQLLRSYFTEFSKTNIDVTFGDSSSWLSFHDSNVTINGDTPSNFESTTVTVDASSDFGSSSRSFRIVGVDNSSSSSTLERSSSATSSALRTSSSSSATTATMAAMTATTSPSSSASSGALPGTQEKESGVSKKLVLGLAIGLPLLALLLGLLFLFFCCFRRRNNNKDDEAQGSDENTQITGPGFGRIDSREEHNETAKQLGAINALKLDEDNRSTLSGATQVDTDEDGYFDATEKPMMSWRANQESDSSAMKKMLLQEKHASDVSMSTVNTENLFSVRLVDNSTPRNSASASDILNGEGVGVTGMTRDLNSGNFQRLDSDGNIVQAVQSSPKRPKASATQTSLNYISEEDTNNISRTPDSSDYNLLAKFLGSQHGSPGSGIDVSEMNDYQGSGAAVPDADDAWRTSVNGTLLPSPDAESFLLGGEVEQKTYPGQNKDAFLSRSSVYSDLSFGVAAGDVVPRDSKVKLVEFTRKASLRDSSREQHLDHSADRAQILDDSD